MKYLLQNRWKVRKVDDGYKLVYYGLRNWPKNKEQIVPLKENEAILLQDLEKSKELNVDEQELLKKFLDENIVVEESKYRQDSTKENYRTCKKCVCNDYVIPGLEFDEEGVCAFCQAYANEKPENIKSLMTIEEEELVKNIKERNKGAHFDVMVFFTGGKDSTYLVWHLSKNLGLRVLAAFWDMPFTNESSRKNMKKVLDALPNVELLQWTLSKETFEEAIKKQYKTMGVFCLCPVPAYPLFYPIAKMFDIPYVMWGMEDVQASVIEYIFPAPASQKQLDEREQTLQILRGRALPGEMKEPITWTSEFHNYHTSLQQIFKPLFGPLTKIIEDASNDPDMPIPIIKRLKTKDSYGSWDSIVETLEKEVGWEMPKNQKNKLHTSCVIENVKDYTQFLKFRNMESVFFPQAMVELSAAVIFGHISREDALEQMDELGYFEPPQMYKDLVKRTTGKEI